MTSVIKPCGEINFAALKLSHGSHGSEFRGEACLVECANLLATCDVDLRERFGKPDVFGDDHPSISRVVRSFAIALNDKWLDDNGNPRGWWCPADAEGLLRPYAARVLGSRTTDGDDEEVRRYLCIDWAARTAAPMWLDAAGQTEDAATLRALPAIVNGESRTAALTPLRKIADAARKRRNVAWERYYEARRRGDAPPAEAAVAVAAEAVEATAVAAAAVAAAEAAAEVAAAMATATATGRGATVAAVAAVAAAAVAEVAAEAAAEAVARLRPTVEQVARSALSLLDQLILVGYENRRPAWRIDALEGGAE